METVNISEIINKANSNNAEIITTEKDFKRISQKFKEKIGFRHQLAQNGVKNTSVILKLLLTTDYTLCNTQSLINLQYFQI